MKVVKQSFYKTLKILFGDVSAHFQGWKGKINYIKMKIQANLTTEDLGMEGLVGGMGYGS